MNEVPDVVGEKRPFHDIQYQLNCLVYDFNRLKFQCDKLVDAIRLGLEEELKKERAEAAKKP